MSTKSQCDPLKLVLLRHGESVWNRDNLFTGWMDVDLSNRGREEAPAAGRSLWEHGFAFNVAFTSVLKRAIRTLWLAAYGNSLRALVKHLDGVSDKELVELNIPTGIPFVYEPDAQLKPIRHYYLGDDAQAHKPWTTATLNMRRIEP